MVGGRIYLEKNVNTRGMRQETGTKDNITGHWRPIQWQYPSEPLD